MSNQARELPSAPHLPRYQAPYDWDAVYDDMSSAGACIIEEFLSEAEIEAINQDLDAFLANNKEAGKIWLDKEEYLDFMGRNTIRAQSLVEVVPRTFERLVKEELICWAERTLDPVSAGVLLSLTEFIQIDPGETFQGLHRDSAAYSEIPRGDYAYVINALFAIDDFTLENGATYVAPGSWQWEDEERMAEPEELTRAVMKAGSVLLFRGDVIHCGGENSSDGRRRAISVGFNAGWLRTPENHFLSVSRDTVKSLSPRLQGLLGYAPYDATARGGAILGVYGIDARDPANALIG